MVTQRACQPRSWGLLIDARSTFRRAYLGAFLGLTLSGIARDTTPPYLLTPCDPMDEEGCVHIPQGPGLGIELNWDYINNTRLEE